MKAAEQWKDGNAEMYSRKPNDIVKGSLGTAKVWSVYKSAKGVVGLHINVEGGTLKADAEADGGVAPPQSCTCAEAEKKLFAVAGASGQAKWQELWVTTAIDGSQQRACAL